MKKVLMLLPLVAIATAATAFGVSSSARAQNYAVVQESDCAMVTPGELSEVVNKAGMDTGLRLPEGMALRTELHCAPDNGSKRLVYSVRATMVWMMVSSCGLIGRSRLTPDEGSLRRNQRV